MAPRGGADSARDGAEVERELGEPAGIILGGRRKVSSARARLLLRSRRGWWHGGGLAESPELQA